MDVECANDLALCVHKYKTCSRTQCGILSTSMQKLTLMMGASNRRWIHSFNCALLLLQLVLVYFAVIVVAHPWMVLFPFSLDDPVLVFTCVCFLLQSLTYLIGLYALFFSKLTLLRFYTTSISAMIFTDIALVVVWAFKFRQVHIVYTGFLLSLWKRPTNGFCNIWDDVQTNRQCCGVVNADDYHWQLGNATSYCGFSSNAPLLPPSCCPPSASLQCTLDRSFPTSCSLSLLRWLHTQADIPTILAFWCLFPLKLVVTLVLRKELKEIMFELLYDTTDQTIGQCIPHWPTECESIDLRRTNENNGTNEGYKWPGHLSISNNHSTAVPLNDSSFNDGTSISVSQLIRKNSLHSWKDRKKSLRNMMDDDRKAVKFSIETVPEY